MLDEEDNNSNFEDCLYNLDLSFIAALILDCHHAQHNQSHQTLFYQICGSM